MVATRTPIFPYIEVLKWLIDHIDTQKCLINDENGGCVKVFLSVEVHKYYKHKDPKEHLIIYFFLKLYELHDTNPMMTSWWREDKKFTNQRNG